MNKNTNETFEKVLVQEFDKDISSHKTKDLQKEILNMSQFFVDGIVRQFPDMF